MKRVLYLSLFMGVLFFSGCGENSTASINHNIRNASFNSGNENHSNYTIDIFNYLSNNSNRQSVGNKSFKLNNGNPHNSCVYFVSESLRRVGCDIPISTSVTINLIKELKARGFKTSFNFDELMPGAICFTTDSSGKIGGKPTHTYIFMSWQSKNVANVCDNQIYDYYNFYHTRSIKFSYFNNQKSKLKEATAFFMYK